MIKLESGQSLFEVVVALAISALIVVALVSLAASSIRNSTFSKNKNLASRYAQEAIEWLRGQRDSNVNNFFTNSKTPHWCFPAFTSGWVDGSSCSGDSDKIPGTLFFRQVDFSSDGVNVVQAVVRVYWSDSQGDHEVRNATNFADWKNR